MTTDELPASCRIAILSFCVTDKIKDQTVALKISCIVCFYVYFLAKNTGDAKQIREDIVCALLPRSLLNDISCDATISL